MAFSRSVMNSEFVSTRNGVSISLPTARMQALMAIARLPDYSIAQCERDAERQVRVDRRHRVVGHDPDSTVQALETIGGIGFHDVGGAKQEEAPQRSGPSDWIQEQGDEYAHHFVDDDLSRIRACEMPFRDAAAPRSAGEERDDRQGLHTDRCREQRPEQEACGRSESAGREWDVADTKRGGQEQRRDSGWGNRSSISESRVPTPVRH